MLPVSLLTISRLSEVSGSASRKGFAISSVGFIFAAVSAIPERAVNAPITEP